MQDGITRKANQILADNQIGITVDNAFGPLEQAIAGIAIDAAQVALSNDHNGDGDLLTTLGVIGVQMSLNAHPMASLAVA